MSLEQPSDLSISLLFQGNAATGGCCSKCFRDAAKKEEDAMLTESVKKEVAHPRMEPMEEFLPMEIDDPPPVAPVEVKQPAVAAEAPKKTKKASYKNMMKSMMKTAPSRDIEKEKEALRKVTGGGAFSKIDKI
jgi:hypothetical protein